MGLTQVNTSSHLGQSYYVGRNIDMTKERLEELIVWPKELVLTKIVPA